MGVPEFAKSLCFAYGSARYERGGHTYDGEIILTPHKLYLTNDTEEISATLIPLEKICRIRTSWNSLEIEVRPSNFMHFTARLKSSRKSIKSLLKDLIAQRNFQKKFFGLEWYDPDFF